MALVRMMQRPTKVTTQHSEHLSKDARKISTPKNLNFKQTSVRYMGHIFRAQGLAADPEKVKAISQMQCPNRRPRHSESPSGRKLPCQVYT